MVADLSIALNRFGLGARADEAVPGEARRWLLDQFARFDPAPAPIAALPDRAAAMAEVHDYYVAKRAARQQAKAAPAPSEETARKRPQPARRERRQARALYTDAVGARVNAALTTPAPFVERLVHFWSNHFAISADKLIVSGLAGSFEFEAIRPHVLGRFSDMLGAVERHPAMLIYLDQARSIGPNSPLGGRITARGKRKAGLNENLGRETMELHTLGVRTGYTQADVTEFARTLTGWTVVGEGPLARRARTRGATGDFAFAARFHEPGVRTIMGKAYAERGQAQAQAVLDDLARHPATARHIAIKLARHFAGDTPPPSLVARLEAAFLESGGDLPTVYRALVDAPEAWVSAPAKFKTPWEWMMSSMRAIGMRDVPARAATGLMQQLGQAVWRPGSPAGFDDVAGAWAGPDAVLRRVQAADRLAGRAREIDARSLATRLFPDALGNTTRQALARAESPGQALALLLVAPEMMRR